MRVAERRAERELWEELEVLPEACAVLGRAACRAAALQRTAEYLGLSGSFEPAATVAAAEIARAWATRNEAVESLGAAMTREQRAIREREIQERYEGEKQAALGQVEALLGSGARHRRFRGRLEEWIDLIR